MHDPLPVGVIPLAAEIDPGDQNNWACQISQNPINVVDCQGDLNPEQEVTIVIDVFMTAESGKSLDNEACVDPANLIERQGAQVHLGCDLGGGHPGTRHDAAEMEAAGS
jgi:hypothetical protein